MYPTSRAHVIASGISGALHAVFDSLKSADVFRPETSTQMFRFAVRSNHPRTRNELTLEQFLSEGHVIVNPWNEALGTVGRELAKMNIRRKIVVELPCLLSAPAIVAGSQLIITLPERAITTLFSSEALARFIVPFAISPHILNVYFHNKRIDTLGHLWMRNFIQEVVKKA